MNKARFDLRYSSLSAVAQKVFHAVPKEEAWAVPQIHNELARKGQNIDRRIVEGCLRALIDQGLITQPSTSIYRQVKVKEPSPIQKSEEIDYMTTPKSALPARMPGPPDAVCKDVPPLPPLDRLSALANSARQMMTALKALSDDIETAALEIAEQMAANEENAAKMKQLQALLKSLG